MEKEKRIISAFMAVTLIMLMVVPVSLAAAPYDRNLGWHRLQQIMSNESLETYKSLDENLNSIVDRAERADSVGNLDGDASLGDGTTNAVLKVKGATTLWSAIDFYSGPNNVIWGVGRNANDDDFYIDRSGVRRALTIDKDTLNVGIDMANPTHKLHVNGDIFSSGTINSSSNVAGSRLCIGTDCRNAWPSGLSGSGTANTIVKWTGSSSLGDSTIFDNGVVGIGAANPGGSQLFVSSSQGSGSNAAMRAIYPAGGGLANTEFAALAHRNGVWSGIYANQGSASYAGLFNGAVQVNGEVNSNKIAAQNNGRGNVYLTTQPGSLPGYGSDTYPTLRTDSSYIYLSTAGGYTGYIGSDTISARSFTDFDHGGYYMNPYGTTNLYNLCLNGDCRSSWPGGYGGYKFYISGYGYVMYGEGLVKNGMFYGITYCDPQTYGRLCGGSGIVDCIRHDQHGVSPQEACAIYFGAGTAGGGQPPTYADRNVRVQGISISLIQQVW